MPFTDAQTITNLYLYGQATTPNLINDALIREPFGTGQYGALRKLFLTQCVYFILDVLWLTNEGIKEE